MTGPARALVRPPPRSYRSFYAAHGVAIDLARADRQHAAYVAALAQSGLTIETVAPDEGFADCVFIEDTAVVWGDRALRTRMAPHREGEQSSVLDALGRAHEIVMLPGDATLDGGDVLHAEAISYVGRSRRTNAAGAAALREFLAPRPVVEIPIEKCLHLKSAATWLGDGTMLAAASLVDVHRFDAATVLQTAPGEAKAANTLRVGNHLLTLDGYPVTGGALANFTRTHGITILPLDVSEFEKGDGSLTCLSILT